MLFPCNPTYFDGAKYRALRMKSQKYVITNGLLYWKYLVVVLLLCLTEDEIPEIINEYHGCDCGGHYSWKATVHKILNVGFY